ncbi:hypothetical protein F2Q70_00011778 [Brassica cretica]|uniref:Uncharacterized protein n=1 Tax=Brassica cretica TaxID=69181 RepID=A0A8S9M4W2_BRACR|nr:hypothetical protein F2Q70_00011778 [Brassica cretica]
MNSDDDTVAAPSDTTVAASINTVEKVHAQQYQKQQENSTAILIRSCKFGTINPQRKTLLIDRQQH